MSDEEKKLRDKIKNSDNFRVLSYTYQYLLKHRTYEQVEEYFNKKEKHDIFLEIFKKEDFSTNK